MLIPVILAGGSGTRLWPISRHEFPKQFAPILGNNEHTLFQKAVLRTRSIPGVQAPIIICNQEHLQLASSQLNQLGIFDAKILVEPVGRNTAPAITCAALYAQSLADNPTLLILPADHVIADEAQFIMTVNIAAQYALEDRLICFGIKPTTPETGYGYIKIGAKLAGDNAYTIDKFVEKPNLELATSYVNSGNYFWNGGIFMFAAAAFLQEMQFYAPDIFAACEAVIQSTKLTHNPVTLAALEFAACRSDSIDYAVLEQTKKAIVVPLDAKWSDVGSWVALWQQLAKDEAANVLVGDVVVANAQNSYIHATKRKIVAIGVKDHIIVETDDVVLVVPKNQAHNLRQIVTKIHGGESK